MILTAWAVMLVVSDLPDILITTLGGTIPPWMLWAKAGFLAAFLVLTLAWKAVRPLWQYAVIFLGNRSDGLAIFTQSPRPAGKPATMTET